MLNKLLMSLGIAREDWIVTARRNYCNRSFDKKAANIKTLSSYQQKLISDFWKSIHPKAERFYSQKWYSVYNNYCKNEDEIVLYLPDDFYYCYLDNYYTNYHTTIKLDNKNMYDMYFHDVNKPKSIVRKQNGILMDSGYNVISLNQAVNFCVTEESIIIKKALNSDGGHGITFFEDCNTRKDEIAKCLTNNDNFIIQSIINQHETLASFNPQSVNTVRIMTFVYDGTPLVLSSVLRMGVNGSKVDNASSGGIVCGIMNTGELRDGAYDSVGQKYITHPQGKRFKGTLIPSYGECEKMAKQLAMRFVNYTRLISWDFSIDKNGNPLLIEANFTGGQLDFHQMCNGPVWGGAN